MTSSQFQSWLAEMQSAGLIRDHGGIQDAANLLGMTRERIRQMMRDGTKTVQTDLACSALLRKVEPYPSNGSAGPA